MSIVTVIQDENEASALVRLGFQFARASQCPFIIVRAIESQKQGELKDFALTDDTTDPVLKLIKTTFEEEKNRALDISQTPHYEYHDEEEIATTLLKVPDTAIKTASGRDLKKLIFRVTSAEKATLLIVGRHQSLKGTRHITDILFEKAHCSTMIIRLGDNDYKRCKKLLIPCSGGPHAREALTLTAKLCDSQGTVINPLIVEPNTGELMEEVGIHTLEKFIKSCGLVVSDSIVPKAIVKDNVTQGICEVARDDYDLVIMGATEGGNLRKKLFGNLAEKVFNISPEVSVAVYRARKPRLRVMRDKLEYWCNVTIPQLEREDRVKLYENLYLSSSWNFDFISLICLSTAIAALGLISNSAAVVIGAMVVAPLMLPILGAGLAIIQGNMPLAVSSIKSITLGFILALGIGFTVGFLTPYGELTSEILSRGSPKLADMFIAFLSGIAAAHCLSRPKLSAALPGVAIAAALVPPIASSGIALSQGDTQNSTGAAILFFTNVVCIVLGSSITFFIAGIRYNKNRASNRWVQQSYIGLILTLGLLAVPLSSTLVSKITNKLSSKKTAGFENVKSKSLAILSKYGVISITNLGIKDERKEEALELNFNVTVREIPDAKIATEMETYLAAEFERKVKVRIIPTLVIETEN